MVKKIGIEKIVFACLAAVAFIISLVVFLVAPYEKKYNDYYVYSTNLETGIKKIEVHIEKNEFYTVTTNHDDTTVTSEKVPCFVMDGRIYLNTTKADYKSLTNEQKSEVFSFKITESTLDYYITQEEGTNKIGTFYDSERDALGNPLDSALNVMGKSMLSTVVMVVVIIFAMLTLVSIVNIVRAYLKVQAENPNSKKSSKPKISFKSIQNKVTGKLLITLAVLSVVLFVMGPLFASGKVPSHTGTYSISDADTPKEFLDEGKSNYKVQFTKDGIVEIYETSEHRIISEPSSYIIRGGRLFIDMTAQDYNDAIKELKEFDSSNEEIKAFLELMSNKISSTQLETNIGLESVTLKSSTGFVIQIIGYVLIGLGGLALLELLISLSQKFVYVLVLKRAPVPEGYAERLAAESAAAAESSAAAEAAAPTPAEEVLKVPEAEAPAEETPKAKRQRKTTKKKVEEASKEPKDDSDNPKED